MKKVVNDYRFRNGLWSGLILITIWSFGAIIVSAQTKIPGCSVNVSKPGAPVAPICRGQQIEEFNYQFEGGLYAQLI